VAREIWRTINGVNLRDNIGPTRERARLILEKNSAHAVTRIRLRNI
jgi:type I pantothenate kinase